MIERMGAAEELWSAATSSYTAWLRLDQNDATWIDQAQKTLALYKEFLKLSVGQPAEARCRAQIGMILFEGATRLGEIKRIIAQGIDNLVNSSRALVELEKAVLLDAQMGGELFSAPGPQELYLPILEGFWILQADHLDESTGRHEAFAYLKNKMAMMKPWGWPYMANACHKLGVFHGRKGQDDLAIIWFQKAIHAADSCRPKASVYQFYQGVKKEALANIEIIEASPVQAQQNGQTAATIDQAHVRKKAAAHKGAADIFPSPALIEKLFNTALPDWQTLLQAAERTKQQKSHLATVAWVEKEAMHSSWSLSLGGMYDIWAMEEGLCLYHHTRAGCLAKIFVLFWAVLAKLFYPFVLLKRALTARISALLAGILGPVYGIKAVFDALLFFLARRLRHWFAFLGIPLALLGFIMAAVLILFSFGRSLLSLLANPLALVREVLLLPFRLLAALLSILVQTLLLPWLVKLLDTAAQKLLQVILQRHPWLRGILLGFLRRERPIYPVLIPKRSVSQLLLMKRRGLFGAQEFLVIVEGDALQIGLGAWLAYQIKTLIFPFYWERTIHMLNLPRKEREKVIQSICSVLGKSAILCK